MSSFKRLTAPLMVAAALGASLLAAQPAERARGGEGQIARVPEITDVEYRIQESLPPNLVLTVLLSGLSSMGRSLGLLFVYLLVVALFAAYVAGRALGPGGREHYPEVSGVAWDETGTMLTLAVKLRPAWRYELVLGGGFLSRAERKPIRDTALQFHTR